MKLTDAALRNLTDPGKHFDGGGHINASGGKYFKSMEETINDFKEKIEAEDF